MDDKIFRALRALPRERAGAEFTAGVLRRLEAPGRVRWRAPKGRIPGRRLPDRRLLLASAAAALLLVLVFGAREWWHLRQRQEIMTRLETLAAERQALVAELATLERQLTEARPVVYLGGTNKVDLVLDLARLRRAGTLIRPGALPQSGVRPPGVRPPEIRPEDIRTVSYQQRQQPPLF